MRISDWSSDVCSSDLPTNNVLKRMHWATFKRLNDTWTQLVWAQVAGTKRGGWPKPPPARVKVTVERHSYKLIDWDNAAGRSEERRVGQECVRTMRSWWQRSYQKKNK